MTPSRTFRRGKVPSVRTTTKRPGDWEMVRGEFVRVPVEVRHG